jgi:hypothetical protein
MLTAEHQDRIRRSVLCWLATADATGQPNVSPKEVFAIEDPSHLLIAHIASPVTVRNLLTNPKACVSLLDLFVQKGLKLTGNAQVLMPDHPAFARHAQPLQALAGECFPLKAVIRLRIESVTPYQAPSYHLIPGTTEATQVAAAMKTYGVTARANRTANPPS